MANLQVRDVPDAVQHELEHERFLAELESREAVDLGVPAAELLREVREERERRQ